MAINVETIKLDGISIKYFRFGTEGKPKIVIIPGLSLQSVTNSAQAIAKQYEIFANDYELYLIDRNEDIHEGYSMQDMASDTIKALDYLNISDANIMGASQGGMIAQIIAINAPKYVHSMVLCSTCSRVNPKDEVMNKWIHLAKSNDKEGLMEAFLQDVYTKDYYDKHKRAIKIFARYIKDEEMQRFVLMASPLLGLNLVDQLSSVNIPTLVCASKQDKVVPLYCVEELIEKLNAESMILDDSSHAMYDESPEFLPRAYDFFKKFN